MSPLILKNATSKLPRATAGRLIHLGIFIGWTVATHGEPLDIGIIDVGSGNDVEFTVTNNTDHGIYYTEKPLGGFRFRIGLRGGEKFEVSSGRMSQITQELLPHASVVTKISFSPERFHLQPNQAYEMDLRWGDVHLGSEGLTIVNLMLETDAANHVRLETTAGTQVKYHPADSTVSAQIKGTNVPVPEIKAKGAELPARKTPLNEALRIGGTEARRADSLAPIVTQYAWQVTGIVCALVVAGVILARAYYAKISKSCKPPN